MTIRVLSICTAILFILYIVYTEDIFPQLYQQFFLPASVYGSLCVLWKFAKVNIGSVVDMMCSDHVVESVLR